MLSWLFKKRGDSGAPKVTPAVAQVIHQPTAAGPSKAELKAQKIEADKALWGPRLASAQGDDAALLAVAVGSPLLEIKLAAVAQLESEESLRQAEREFRNHDRRAHSEAKRRFEAAVAQRESRAKAEMLIEALARLTDPQTVALNHLAGIDRDWLALNAKLLQPDQTSRFHELRQQLDDAIRESADRQQRLQRWTADAHRALADLRDACAQAASTGLAADTRQACQAVQAMRDLAPESPSAALLDETLATALHTAALLADRLTWLAALDHHPVQIEVKVEALVETRMEAHSPPDDRSELSEATHPMQLAKAGA
ncbi:MAG: hypothetical protein EBY28_26360, partial [Betaproteobacteria bacterium]|nr:hypothetical protein [Betaproteobacteria bacterium]